MAIKLPRVGAAGAMVLLAEEFKRLKIALKASQQASNESKLELKRLIDDVRGVVSALQLSKLDEVSVKALIAEAELDDLTLEQVQEKILQAVSDKAAVAAVNKKNAEQDRKINQKANQSEVNMLASRLATKAEVQQVADIEQRLGVMNERLDAKFNLEPLNQKNQEQDVEISKKASQSDVSQLQNIKLDKTDFDKLKQKIPQMFKKMDEMYGFAPNLLQENKVLTITPINNAYNGKSCTLPTPLTQGETYTFSADVAFTHGISSEITIYFQPGGDTIHMPVQNGTVQATFNARSGRPEKMWLYAGRSGATHNIGVTFDNVKLEPGSQKTGWRPNYDIMAQFL